MISDTYGNKILESYDIAELLFEDRYHEPMTSIRNTQVDLFNAFAAEVDSSYLAIQHFKELKFDSIDAYDKAMQSRWMMPIDYQQFDIRSELLERAPGRIARERVEMELGIYERKGLIDVLRFMNYLVDLMREHKITWGVGRGSSLASYCLFLIGIHKVDSIKYNLDFDEFLKE